MEDAQLIIELVKQATRTVEQAERRLSSRMAKIEDSQFVSVEKQNELSESVAALKIHVTNLQTQVKKISKVLGTHKKKGLFALFVVSITSAAIGSGQLNYQALIEKIFGFFIKK